MKTYQIQCKNVQPLPRVGRDSFYLEKYRLFDFSRILELDTDLENMLLYAYLLQTEIKTKNIKDISKIINNRLNLSFSKEYIHSFFRFEHIYNKDGDKTQYGESIVDRSSQQMFIHPKILYSNMDIEDKISYIELVSCLSLRRRLFDEKLVIPVEYLCDYTAISVNGLSYSKDNTKIRFNLEEQVTLS